MQRGMKVLFAGNEWQQRFINSSIEGVETAGLEGYEVQYSRSKSGFMPVLMMQVPKLLLKIQKEQEWLQNLTAERKIDGIVSDNRYGLYHDSIDSVFMTHQLSVITGLGSTSDSLVRKLHYRLIERFRRCWIVDLPGKPNLSGKLAHPRTLPRNAEYLGLLSQLHYDGKAKGEVAGGDYILVLLSGPEPQRSILSDLLWQQAVKLEEKIVFVEGSMSAGRKASVPRHIEYHLQLTKQHLVPLMENAEVVICRSGYSTLMDLTALGKKAILIPTPGQTEQEFLGQHLQEQGSFLCRKQEEFDLFEAISSVKDFPFNLNMPPDSFKRHEQVVNVWLDTLKG